MSGSVRRFAAVFIWGVISVSREVISIGSTDMIVSCAIFELNLFSGGKSENEPTVTPPRKSKL